MPLSRVVLSIVLLVTGCGGSSKPSDRAATAAAIASGATVAGRVTHQGAPVEGAFVVLASRTTGETPDLLPAGLFSDAAGTFSIGGLPADRYDVIVVADGLVGEAALDLTTGSAPPLDVTLVPAEVAATDLQGGALERLLGAGRLDPDLSLQSEDGGR
jgi:hypothetical protein